MLKKQERGTSLYSDTRMKKKGQKKLSQVPAYIGTELGLRLLTVNREIMYIEVITQGYFDAVLYVRVFLFTGREHTSSYMISLPQSESKITNSLGCRLK